MPLPPLAFVDLETTGAAATADRITEIGMVLVDESGVSEWSSLVNPGTPIPPFITGLTGISDVMVAEAPDFAKIAGEISERLAGRLFVAHNARFDYGFLKNEFRRAGLDFRATVLCTVKLSRKMFPQHPRHNLDSLIARHGLQVGDRHHALGDARLIYQFWQKLHAELPAEQIEAVVAAITARPSLPPHLDPAVVESLPEGPGVYLFYGENALPLYVGKSTGIRKRVLSHFAADHATAKEMSLAQQVRRIECVQTGGEISALLKEAELIKRLQPTHNRVLRRNAEECLWRLLAAGPGDWRPQLVLASELGAIGEKLYGPFKTAREAKRVLAELARAHELCPGLLGLEALKPGRPCFAHQVRQCRGACVGKEPVSFHSARLMAALDRLRVVPWPFAGPAWLREGDEALLFDAWRHLGSARDDAELAELLGQPLPTFERDVYLILQAAVARMTPLA
jgi:DNA polymerase-3 subunit epsilon